LGFLVGFFVGLTGWLAFFAVLAVLVVGGQRHRFRQEALERSFAGRMQELREKARALEGQWQATMAQAREELAGRQRRAGELRRELRRLQAEKASLERQLAEARAAATVAGAPPAEADLPALAAEKARLLEEYVAAYQELKRQFLQVRATARPELLAGFAERAAKTPLGPAAYFFAAERYRLKGEVAKALELFATVAVRYPGAEYVELARARMAEMRAGRAIKEGKEPGILPYQPLSRRIL
jgi:hypothetical protein